MTIRAASNSKHFSFYCRRGKGLFDLALGSVLTVLTLPLMAAIALGILLTSGRPSIFRQVRIGVRGKPFEIYKFRTMELGAAAGGPVTVAGDRRVTRIGRFLRRYKLDELPQLWNVVKGDMSFVGPRPEVPEYANTLTGVQRAILEIRPGITGPASVAYRNEDALLAATANPEEYNRSIIYPAKITMNLAYAETISFRSDLYWILRTVFPALPVRVHFLSAAKPVRNCEKGRLNG